MASLIRDLFLENRDAVVSRTSRGSQHAPFGLKRVFHYLSGQTHQPDFGVLGLHSCGFDRKSDSWRQSLALPGTKPGEPTSTSQPILAPSARFRKHDNFDERVRRSRLAGQARHHALL